MKCAQKTSPSDKAITQAKQLLELSSSIDIQINESENVLKQRQDLHFTVGIRNQLAILKVLQFIFKAMFSEDETLVGEDELQEAMCALRNERK